MYFKKTIFSLVAGILSAQASNPLTQEEVNFIQSNQTAKALEETQQYSQTLLKTNEAKIEELKQQIKLLPRPNSVAEDGTLMINDKEGVEYTIQVGALKQQRDRLKIENTVTTFSADEPQKLFSLYKNFDYALAAQKLLSAEGFDVYGTDGHVDFQSGYKYYIPVKKPLIKLMARAHILQNFHVIDLILDPMKNDIFQAKNDVLQFTDGGSLNLSCGNKNKEKEIQQEIISNVIEKNRVEVLSLFPKAFDEPQAISTDFKDFQIALRERVFKLDGKIGKLKTSLKKELKKIKKAENMLKGVGSSSTGDVSFDPQELLKVGNQFYKIIPKPTDNAETLQRTMGHIQGSMLHKTKKIQIKLESAYKEHTILAKVVHVFDELLNLVSHTSKFS